MIAITLWLQIIIITFLLPHCALPVYFYAAILGGFVLKSQRSADMYVDIFMYYLEFINIGFMLYLYSILFKKIFYLYIILFCVFHMLNWYILRVNYISDFIHFFVIFEY